jgi:general secretion pathway protein C
MFFANEEQRINTNTVITSSKQNTRLPTGIFGVEKQVVKKVYKKVVKTKLNLKLVGVINKKPTPVAIIQFLSGGVDKVYKIGDKINSSASVKDIGDNFVIIDHNGKDEKLSLKFKTSKEFKVEEQNETPQAKESTNKSTKKVVKLVKKNKQKLTNYLVNMRTNPASALAVVSVEPNFVSGLLNGFKVAPSKERKLFTEIGFKKGDIILEINNIQLNSLSKAFKIGKELSSQRVFDFVVLRDGLEHYINLDLN